MTAGKLYGVPGFSAKFPAKAFDAAGNHTGPGPWLNLVWAANGVEPGTFGEPEISTQPDGRYFEDYPDVRVIICNRENIPDPRDEWVIVCSKTDRGAEILTKAEAELAK